MKHTEGPWRVATKEDKEFLATFNIDKSICLIVADDIKGDPWPWTIAEINGGLLEGGQEANAALIAAAPDLLAACEASFDFLDCDPEEITIERADRLFEQLRKAIAKAKGEAK